MKSKRIIILVIIIISVLLVYGICMMIYSNKGKINQGAFRINDIVVKSIAEYEEIQNYSTEVNEMLDMKFNVSQKNTISFLVAKEKEANNIYIDNISMTIPKNAGDIFLSQNGYEKINVTELEGKTINIVPQYKYDQYTFELQIDNLNFLKEKSIINDVKYIKYDGTLLKNMGITASDISSNLKFNLNLEYEGKKCVCKFEINIPNDDLIENGISIYQLEVSNFPFYIK